MVAPTSTTVPSSITGRNESCCARLKRCTSSTNSKRALAGLAPGTRRVEHLLQVGDPGKHRGNLLEMQFGRIGQQPGHRGLAGARRSPEDQRTQRARRQHARQRAVGTENVILSDDIRQRTRAQSVRKRMRRILLHPRGSEQVCSFAWSLRAHPPSVTLICWPPRTSVMRQIRDGLARRLFEIAGPGDLLIVDRQDDDRPSGSRRWRPFRRRPDRSPRRLRCRDRDAVHRPPPARCSRPWRPGTASGRSGRFRCGRCRARFPAAPSASRSCRPRSTSICAVPPSGRVAKR